MNFDSGLFRNQEIPESAIRNPELKWISVKIDADVGLQLVNIISFRNPESGIGRN